MMDTVLLIILSLASTLAAWLFLAVWKRRATEETAEAPEKAATVTTPEWRPTRKRLAFLIFMFLGLAAISVALEQIYENNTLTENAKLIVLLAILFIAANTDARERLIPNKLVLSGIVLRVIFWIVELITIPDNFLDIVKNDLYACLLVVLFFVVGVLLVKGGIGMGDIKLMLVMCLFQGFYGVVSSLFCSLFVAFVYAIIVLLLRKKTKKDSVAFAPAILLGTALSVFLTGM